MNAREFHFHATTYAQQVTQQRLKDLVPSSNLSWSLAHQDSDFLLNFPLVISTAGLPFCVDPKPYCIYLGIYDSGDYVVFFQLQNEYSEWFSNLVTKKLTYKPDKIHTELDLQRMMQYLDQLPICSGCRPIFGIDDIPDAYVRRGKTDGKIIGGVLVSASCYAIRLKRAFGPIGLSCWECKMLTNRVRCFVNRGKNRKETKKPARVVYPNATKRVRYFLFLLFYELQPHNFQSLFRFVLFALYLFGICFVYLLSFTTMPRNSIAMKE